ncbi:MAG TPA: DMT family transporter [Pyrinomonadaceae bacterium]|nr:DMT family transporter [Pyrinomonadaceae bacterium]
MSSGKSISNIPPQVLVLIAVLMWSTGGVLIKLTSLNAFQITFFRSFLAAVTVLFLTRKAGLGLNLYGIITSAIYAILLFLFVWATKHTTAANAIFLQYTAPIYILILGPFIIGERFHWRDLITIIFCIGGMTLFFVGKLELNDYWGNIAALCSGIFLGLYIMLLRHPRAAGTNSVIAVIYGNFLLALLTASSGVAAISIISLRDFVLVAVLGIFQIGLSYILFIKGVTSGTRPLDASIIGFFEPILNPVWVFLFYGEQPSNWAILGGLVIVATVAFHTLVQYRSRSDLNRKTFPITEPPAAPGGLS